MFNFINIDYKNYFCFFCLENLKHLKYIIGYLCLICSCCIKRGVYLIFKQKFYHHFKNLKYEYYDNFKYCLKSCVNCIKYYSSIRLQSTIGICAFNDIIIENSRFFEYDSYLICKNKYCLYCLFYYKNHYKYKRNFFLKFKKLYLYKKNSYLNLINPEEIYFFLGKFIIGQEKAKKFISSSIYYHYRRIELNLKYNTDITKSNMLLIGPTGCGKTFIIKTISKLLNIPLVIVDSNNLTETGYVGEDSENIIQKLFYESGQNIDKTKIGIVFIDEIDKISCKNTNNNRDISGEGVQNALLKIIEGKIINFTTKINGKVKNITIGTENILFICGGAFSMLDLNNYNFKNNTDFNITIIEKIINYGIIPELLWQTSYSSII